MVDKMYKKAAGDSILVEGTKGWFVSRRKRCVCEVDFANQKGRILKYLGSSQGLIPIYMGLAKKGDRLYVYPGVESKILVLNLEGEQIKTIDIKQLVGREKLAKEMKVLFQYAFSYEKYVFFLGCGYPAIIRLNTENDELTYITDWVEKIEKKNNHYGYFAEGYVIKSEKAYIPIGCTSAILELDVNTLQSDIIDIETTATGIAGITEIDDEICCLSCGGDAANQILLWNMKDNIIEKTIPYTMFNRVLDPIHAVAHIKNKLYLCMNTPWFIDFFEYNLDTDELKLNEKLNKLDFGDVSSYLDGKATMSIFSEDNNILHFVTGKDWRWHKYNTEMDELESYDIYFEGSEEIYEKILGDTIIEQVALNDFVKEAEVPLEGLINYILSN